MSLIDKELPFQQELIINLATEIDVEGDGVVEIVLPLELSTKSGLIEAIKEQNNDRVNQELSTLLQCIEVNRLLAVKRIINQLNSTEWYCVSNDNEQQLYAFFVAQLDQLFQDFHKNHLSSAPSAVDCVNKLFDKVVTMLSIYEIISQLGFVGEKYCGSLFCRSLFLYGIVLNEFGLRDKIMELAPSVDSQVALLTSIK